MKKNIAEYVMIFIFLLQKWLLRFTTIQLKNSMKKFHLKKEKKTRTLAEQPQVKKSLAIVHTHTHT